MPKKKIKKKLAVKTKSQKKTKKKVKRKYTIKPVPDITDLDILYKIINTVQLDKKETRICLSDKSIAPIVENVLKDTNLEFDKRETKNLIYYKIHPNFEEVAVDIDVDELEDEFIEEGYIF